MYIKAADVQKGMNLICFESVDSTNSFAREYVRGGGDLPALFVAESQSGGRGRQGKSFYSPHGSGVYMSLLFDVTDEPPRSVVSLTSAAAVAVCTSCESIGGCECGIKWVNDIYAGGKKVAGILAELFEDRGRKYVIIGVGVNLGKAEFPEELRDIAGTLGCEATEKNKRELVLEITSKLTDIRKKLADGDFSYMDIYRSRSVVLGREVTFTQNGVTQCGTAENITDTGALTVCLADGEKKVLSSGEISLRLI